MQKRKRKKIKIKGGIRKENFSQLPTFGWQEAYFEVSVTERLLTGSFKPEILLK